MIRSIIMIAVVGSLGCSPIHRGAHDGVQGETGAQGVAGVQGPAGLSCTVQQIEGGALITCPDGSVASISNGKDCRKKGCK